MWTKTEDADRRVATERPRLTWRAVEGGLMLGNINRTPIPGGWLVSRGDNGITFVPDPEHTWDGGSVALDSTQP
jgi:hypothetical protein